MARAGLTKAGSRARAKKVRRVSRNTKVPKAPTVPPTVSDLGHAVDQIEVVVSGHFLELFSSNLYSSPNKAFEELVSNSWDAGASTTYIRVPVDLAANAATIAILDNGESMDASGLKQLWRVGTSEKPGLKALRAQIGKFGIGKLSTYLLAERLTYICRAKDGIVRSVEMNYNDIDQAKGGGANLLNPGGLKLELRELSSADLNRLLKRIPESNELKALIDAGVPRKAAPTDDYVSEFGYPEAEPPKDSETWTLVLMTALKPAGRKLQLGWIRWLLRTALPLGNSIAVVLNGDVLESSKSDLATERTYIIGPDLELDSLDVRFEESEEPVAVTAGLDPVPHICIAGISGKITGTVTLYDQRITGKSDEQERSNGFFINVLGRVVNAGPDGYFGLENLSHTVWSQFRACIRADGLDGAIRVNRETLTAGKELSIFRAFLREMFNRCRRVADNPDNVPGWPTVGEELAQSWGAIPLRSFSRALHRFAGDNALPPTIRIEGVTDLQGALQQFDADMRADPGSLIKTVVFERLGVGKPLYSYDLASRFIVVNSDHPFVLEHGNAAAAHKLLQSTAVAEILSDAYLVDIGVGDSQIAEYQSYRDNLHRIIAQITRSSGITIAAQLIAATSDADALEVLALEAVRYLGFTVEEMRVTGKPEGVAVSPVSSSKVDPKKPYRFTIDAKSSQRAVVKTKDVHVSGLADHQKTHGAHYTLIVAPDYEKGQLERLALVNNVTPVRARDLAKLLMLAATTGPIDLREFEGLFDQHNPSHAEQWIGEFASRTLAEPRLSLDTILSALNESDFREGEPINVNVIVDRLKRNKSVPRVGSITKHNVLAVFQGLSVLVPDLVRVEDNREYVYFGTSAAKLKEAVQQQIERVPPAFRYGLEVPALRKDHSGPTDLSKSGIAKAKS